MKSCSLENTGFWYVLDANSCYELQLLVKIFYIPNSGSTLLATKYHMTVFLNQWHKPTVPKTDWKTAILIDILDQ